MKAKDTSFYSTKNDRGTLKSKRTQHVDKLHPDIEVVTSKGQKVVLKWKKPEYRAFSEDGTDLRLGATLPEGLIEYIKRNF